MAINYEDAAKGPLGTRFVVTLTNVSKQTFSFATGTVINCGRTADKSSVIKVNLTESGGALHRRLPYLGNGPPYNGIGAGRLELYRPVLAPGESLSLFWDISRYVDLSDAKQFVAYRFPAGTYSIQAELTNGTDASTGGTQVWSGTVKSDTLRIDFAHEFSAPLGDYSY